MNTKYKMPNKCPVMKIVIYLVKLINYDYYNFLHSQISLKDTFKPSTRKSRRSVVNEIYFPDVFDVI